MCLALALRRVGEAIRTGLDNPRHTLAKTVAHVLKPCFAALIFHAIVKKSRKAASCLFIFPDFRMHFKPMITSFLRTHFAVPSGPAPPAFAGRKNLQRFRYAIPRSHTTARQTEPPFLRWIGCGPLRN